MTGTLGLFSLVDLFQLLAGSSRSGRLTVDHPTGSARVYFEDGRVVHAEFGELAGEQAVYELFANEEGSFEFMLGLPSPRSTIDTRTENLVLEATRRLDEARRDERSSLDAQVVPSFAEGSGGSGNLSLTPAEVSLLRKVDGRRSLGEIARDAGMEPDDARAIVQRLLDVGVLRLAGRRPRTARLVTQLSSASLPHGTAGVDPNILDSWRKAMGETTQAIACRRPDGQVRLLAVTPSPEAGPYLLLSRDTMLHADLRANQPLLVKPLPLSPADATAGG